MKNIYAILLVTALLILVAIAAYKLAFSEKPILAAIPIGFLFFFFDNMRNVIKLRKQQRENDSRG